jgi:hypothetical protein
VSLKYFIFPFEIHVLPIGIKYFGHYLLTGGGGGGGGKKKKKKKKKKKTSEASLNY